jgi:hypothetical protein
MLKDFANQNRLTFAMAEHLGRMEGDPEKLERHSSAGMRC